MTDNAIPALSLEEIEKVHQAILTKDTDELFRFIIVKIGDAYLMGHQAGCDFSMKALNEGLKRHGL